MEREERYLEMRRATLLGAVVNLFLAVFKILFGLIGQSQALVADGLHSLSDLVSDAVVLLAARHGTREADEDHPYGHGRIETAGTVGISIILFFVAIGLIADAVRRLAEPSLLLVPSGIALLIAVLSIVANEALYHYTRRVADRVRSDLMHANAWHHRSDAISSVVVVLGIGGSMAGIESLDAAAAIVVALMIIKIAWVLGWKSIRELIDTGLDPDQVAEIKGVIRDVAGVQSLHMLRTRRMGSETLADVHILVSPRISVSEGHQISEQVRCGLIDRFEDITDVVVHIDPEDDEIAPASVTLPDRDTLLASLRTCWRGIDGAEQVSDVVLHYLDGQIQVDVYLPLELAATAESGRALARRFAELDRPAGVTMVRVNFR